MRWLLVALLLAACGGDSPLAPEPAHPLSGCGMTNVRRVNQIFLRTLYVFTDTAWELTQEIDGREVWRSDGPLRMASNNGVEVRYVMERWTGQYFADLEDDEPTELPESGPFVVSMLVGFRRVSVQGREYELDCR